MIIQMIYNAIITLIGVLTIRFDLLSPLLVPVCASVCIALIIIPGGESKTMGLRTYYVDQEANTGSTTCECMGGGRYHINLEW